MAPLTRVLFLGIDAGDKSLLQSWVADGTLKTLRDLIHGGLSGDTMSLDGFYEGSTWPSFYTGVTPARHGFHRLVQLRPGTYTLYQCLPGELIKREPFWNHLSHAGRRVAIFDIPLSAISRSIHGIQTVEWGSHDAAYGFQTWPPGLKQEVRSRFGLYPMEKSCDSFGRNQRLTELRDLLVQGVKKKTMLTVRYLKKGGWDLFAQVFTESHCIGHQCFHLHDPRHPSYDPEIAASTGDLIRDVYAAIDAGICEILQQIDDNTVVIVLASHRMSHNFGAQFLLSEILTRLRVVERLLPQAQAAQPKDHVERVSSILGWFSRHLPAPAKEKLTLFRRRLHGGFHDRRVEQLTSLGIDFKNSKCFPLDNGLSVSGIRLNLAGREPDGIVRPGEESDAFCAQLVQDLLDIIDCDTRLPMVKSVKRTADLYQGQRLNHLPDLLIEWNDEKRLGSVDTGNPTGSRLRLTSDKIGLVEGKNTYCRTGDHRPQGLFIAHGKGIMKGSLERTVSIMDFAPTFTRLLGVELPDFDGQPITEILGQSA
jgi:predicted AlkP superfamily phosphohydrolase/phosphomutase